MKITPQRFTAGVLAGIAGLHAVWAAGSSWPLGDHRAMADAVAGRPDAPPPGPVACLAVAGLLASAAALVDGRPHRLPFVQRTGARVVTGVLAVRGIAGVAGRTDLLIASAPSPRFRRLDRRVFGPLCLTLAAMAAPRPGASRRAP